MCLYLAEDGELANRQLPALFRLGDQIVRKLLEGCDVRIRVFDRMSD